MWGQLSLITSLEAEEALRVVLLHLAKINEGQSQLYQISQVFLGWPTKTYKESLL